MRSFLIRVFGFLCVLLVLCGLLVAFLPTIASTDWGRNQIVNWINHSIPGQVEIRHLELHWTKGQLVEGILLKDPAGQSVLGIEKLSTEGTLLQLLQKSTHLGFTQIQELNAAITSDEMGKTNLQNALGISSQPDLFQGIPSTILLSDVNADLHLFSKNMPLSISVSGGTKQNTLAGSFEIKASLAGLHPADWDKFQEEAQKYLSIEGSKDALLQAHVVNFPVDLLDRLAALKDPKRNGIFRSILGDRLNLSVEKEPSSTGLAFNMTAAAPLMEGAVKGQILKDLFTLQEPAKFRFKLTAESIKALTHGRVEFLEPSSVKVDITQLTFPLAFLDGDAPIDPCQFGFQATAVVDPAALTIQPIGKIRISSLETHLEAPLCDPSIHVEVTGIILQQKEPFNLNLRADLKKPNSLSGLLEQIRNQAGLSLKVTDFPLQLVPQLKERAALIEQIGPKAKIQLSLSDQHKAGWLGRLSVQTSNLNLHEAAFQIDQNLTLLSPMKVDWQLPANCLVKELDQEQLSLDQTCLVHLTVTDLQVPLDDHRSAQFQIDTSIPLIRFNQLYPDVIAQIKNLNVKAHGRSIAEFSTDVKAEVALLNRDGTPSPLVDPSLHLTQTATWHFTDAGSLRMPEGKLELKNTTSNVVFEGKIVSDKEFKLTAPINMRYTLTPQGLQSLSKMVGQEWPALNKPAVADISVEPFTFNWSSSTFPLSRIHAKGMLSIDEIALKDESESLPVLEEIVVPWNVDGLMNTFSIYLSGLAYTKNSQKPTQLSSHIEVERWHNEGKFDPKQAKIEIQSEFFNLLTADIGPLVTSYDLALLLGPVIDIDFQTLIDLEHKIPGYWDMNVDSAALHSKMRLKFDQEMTLFDPLRPAEFRWTVSPEACAYLRKIMNWESGLKLESPVTLSGTVPHVKIPIKEIRSWADQGEITFNFKSSDIEWKGLTDYPYSLNGQITSQNIRSEVNLACNIESNASPVLSVKAAIGNLVGSQGLINPVKEMKFDLKAGGSRIPSGFVQSLFLLDDKAKQKIQALFGPTIDAEANIQLKELTGPLAASIKGSQGFAEINGKLNKGILTLNSPLVATTQVTPFFSKVFLEENVPLLSTAFGAEQPIKISIDPDHFSCPIIPFDLDGATIGKGVIDLGKIHCRNAGELNALLNMIYPIKDQQITLWFTPLFFQLDKSQLTYKRTDLLVAHTYSLASWGTLDLKTHQMNLILGLSPQTLQYAFGIHGLDDRYLFQIPLHTRKGKLEVDKMKLTAGITALIAQTQAGSKGKLLGDLLNMAVSDHGEPLPPPPTTQPLPWAAEMNQSGVDGDDKEGKKDKKKKKTLIDLDSEDLKGELQQGALKALDRLFGQ